MNKKAEQIAFATSGIAVVASLILIILQATSVAAPPATYIFEMPPLAPPLKTLCVSLDGECKNSCATGEAEIGGDVQKLGCPKPSICCKDTDTCEGFGFRPCFWTPDCNEKGKKDFVCKILTDDQVTRCCTEWKVKICHKPGTPGQKTIPVTQRELPSHLAHGDFEGECCVNLGLVECIKTADGQVKDPGCDESTGAPAGSVCDRTHGSTGATCCIPPLLTPTPTETPTEVPTETPEPTSTPEPTGTPEPTETPAPTETPIPTGTPVPTMTPIPTGSPGPTPTPSGTPS